MHLTYVRFTILISFLHIPILGILSSPKPTLEPEPSDELDESDEPIHIKSRGIWKPDDPWLDWKPVKINWKLYTSWHDIECWVDDKHNIKLIKNGKTPEGKKKWKTPEEQKKSLVRKEMLVGVEVGKKDTLGRKRDYQRGLWIFRVQKGQNKQRVVIVTGQDSKDVFPVELVFRFMKLLEGDENYKKLLNRYEFSIIMNYREKTRSIAEAGNSSWMTDKSVSVGNNKFTILKFEKNKIRKSKIEIIKRKPLDYGSADIEDYLTNEPPHILLVIRHGKPALGYPYSCLEQEWNKQKSHEQYAAQLKGELQELIRTMRPTADGVPLTDVEVGKLHKINSGEKGTLADSATRIEKIKWNFTLHVFGSNHDNGPLKVGEDIKPLAPADKESIDSYSNFWTKFMFKMLNEAP